MPKNCIATYSSRHHIKRSPEPQGIETAPTSAEPVAKRYRSVTERCFSFGEHCIFRREKCLPFDTRQPDRWRSIVFSRTADQGKSHSRKLSVRPAVNGLTNEQKTLDLEYCKLQATFIQPMGSITRAIFHPLSAANQ